MENVRKIHHLNSQDVSLVSVGISNQVCEVLLNWPVDAHDVFIAMVQGKGSLTVNHQSYPLLPHSLTYLRQGTDVKFELSAEEESVYAWCALSGNHVHDYLESLADSTFGIRHGDCGDDLFLLFLQIVRDLSRVDSLAKSSDRAFVLSRVYQLLSELDSGWSQEVQTLSSKNPEQQAEEIYHYICLNLGQSLNIEDLAQHFQMTRYALFRLIKKYYGISPKELIVSMRMFEAQKMLLNSSLQIYEIANLVGYKDAFQFSKIFKSQFGLSPSHFRKENAGS